MARSQQGARMTNSKWWSAALIAGVIGVVGVSSLSAMVVVPAEFSEMVTASELVVHGRVVDVRAQIVGDRRTIETVVTVSVLDAIKGQPGATVYFKVPGGQIGRYRRFMVGAPEFASGEEVVLFLKGRPPAVPFPFGLSQGVYRVVRDETGRTLVTPPVVSEAAGRVVRGDSSRRPMELATFARNVRMIAERQP